MEEYQQMYSNYHTNTASQPTYTYLNIPDSYSLSNLRYHYSPPPPPPPPPMPMPQDSSNILLCGYWPAAATVYNMNYYRYGASLPCSICQYYGVYDHQPSRMDISSRAWDYPPSPQDPTSPIITNTPSPSEPSSSSSMPCDEQTTAPTPAAAAMLPILEECTSSPPQEDAEEGSDCSEVDWQDDIDPDNMTYEELLDLGETVGSQSRGLTQEMIDLLPKSKHKSAGFFSLRRCAERCVICQMRYKRGEHLINLPCKHIYHTDCASTWLKINKACPICNREVKFD